MHGQQPAPTYRLAKTQSRCFDLQHYSHLSAVAHLGNRGKSSCGQRREPPGLDAPGVWNVIPVDKPVHVHPEMVHAIHLPREKSAPPMKHEATICVIMRTRDKEGKC